MASIAISSQTSRSAATGPTRESKISQSDSLTINLLASLADQELALVRGNANDLDFIPIIESEFDS